MTDVYSESKTAAIIIIIYMHYMMHLQAIEISPEQLVALAQQMPISLLYHQHQQQSNCN